MKFMKYQDPCPRDAEIGFNKGISVIKEVRVQIVQNYERLAAQAKKTLTQRIEYYTQLLQGLHKGSARFDSDPNTAHIKALFKHIIDPDKYLKAAKGIRIQRAEVFHTKRD